MRPRSFSSCLGGLVPQASGGRERRYYSRRFFLLPLTLSLCRDCGDVWTPSLFLMRSFAWWAHLIEHWRLIGKHFNISKRNFCQRRQRSVLCVCALVKLMQVISQRPHLCRRLFKRNTNHLDHHMPTHTGFHCPAPNYNHYFYAMQSY